MTTKQTTITDPSGKQTQITTQTSGGCCASFFLLIGFALAVGGPGQLPLVAAIPIWLFETVIALAVLLAWVRSRQHPVTAASYAQNVAYANSIQSNRRAWTQAELNADPARQNDPTTGFGVTMP